MKISKMLVVVLMSMNVLRPSIGNTQETQCEDVIKACDHALADQKKIIDDQKAIIDLTVEKLAKQEETIADQADSLDSWTKQAIYTVPLGATLALGIVATPLVFVASGLIVLQGIFRF